MMYNLIISLVVLSQHQGEVSIPLEDHNIVIFHGDGTYSVGENWMVADDDLPRIKINRNGVPRLHGPVLSWSKDMKATVRVPTHLFVGNKWSLEFTGLRIRVQGLEGK